MDIREKKYIPVKARKRTEKRTKASGLICGTAGLVAAFSMLLSPLSALADEAAAGAEVSGYTEEQRSYDPARFDLPEDAERLVVTEAEGLRANVSMYSIDETGGISLIMSTDEGFIGRKGMGKVMEGDEKTPAGLFKMNTPFGISDKLEGFPENYLKVDPTYYWNGDSSSPLYNKLVSTRDYDDFSKSASEHLINYGGYYNYCIDTGYNPDGTPHKGSALFLHCSMGINTGGCIAIPEADMITVMRNYVEGGTYIISDTKGEFEKYYRADAAETALPEESGIKGNIAEDDTAPENSVGQDMYAGEAEGLTADSPAVRVIYAPGA